MTKTVKKLLICLMALAMTVCSGIALLGLNTTVVNAESTYDIKILGTSLSDSNLTFDNSDNASVTGSLTYSPEESKLTLNNFVFNGATGVDVINVVVSTSKNLTIELIGDSEITITENTSPSKSPAAFYFKDSVTGEIRFVGGGSFTVDNAGIKSGRAAFYAYYKNIFVYNCQLTGKGYNTGIQYYDSIAAYGENASILATATNPYSERPSYSSSNLYIYPALAPMGGYTYRKLGNQKVEVSFEIDGSDSSTSVDTSNKGIYASYKYFHITVSLVYVVYSEQNVITRYQKITNEGQNPIFLDKISSACLDFYGHDFDMITLEGMYLCECSKIQRTALRKGIQSTGSMTGTTSHHANPFFALAGKNADENLGEVYAFNLVYSGSFKNEIEVDRLGNTRIISGINESSFRWKLNAKDEFSTPEFIMT